MDRNDLEMPLLRGVLWNNPRGAVIGQLLFGGVGAAVGCATSGTMTALLMSAMLGFVGAYGGAIIEESASAPGRVCPQLRDRLIDAAASARWGAIWTRAALRRAWRSALEQLRALPKGRGPRHGGMAPVPA